MEKDLRIAFLNDIYGALLTDNQRDMVRSYYDCDLSLGEIAENCGISRQAVRDSIGKGREALLEYERKLGIVSKYEDLKKSMTECLAKDDVGEIKSALKKIIASI